MKIEGEGFTIVADTTRPEFYGNTFLSFTFPFPKSNDGKLPGLVFLEPKHFLCNIYYRNGKSIINAKKTIHQIERMRRSGIEVHVMSWIDLPYTNWTDFIELEKKRIGGFYDGDFITQNGVTFE